VICRPLHEIQAPLILKPGDPIRLRSLTAVGAAWLERDGNLWTVLRVEACALPLELQAGLLIATDNAGTKAKWLAFSDPNVYIEPCSN